MTEQKVQSLKTQLKIAQHMAIALEKKDPAKAKRALRLMKELQDKLLNALMN